MPVSNLIADLKKHYLKTRFQVYASIYKLKSKASALWLAKMKPKIILAGYLLYVIVVLLIAIGLLPFLNDTNVEKNVPGVLMSAGAMLGGVLAIIFSFGTLLMQNAASSSSAGFYNVVGRDRIQDFIYWVISFTVICCFALAITLGRIDALGDYSYFLVAAVPAAFFFIGVSFLLLYVLFQRIYRRVNPFSNVHIIQNEALSYIRKVSKVAKEIADLTLKQPDLPSGYNKDHALAASYQFVKPQIAAIGTRLDYLFDFHDKLVSNKEQEFAKSVLNVAFNILAEYMRQRKDSSIILPDRDIFFAGVSDSQAFLSPQLENLVSRGKTYIRQNNDNGVTHVIKLLRELTLISAEIKYLTDHHQDNPIFSLCRENLDELTRFAVGQKAFEASFQCAFAYNQIGIVACQKHMDIEVRSIVDLISNLCISSLMANQDVVWGQGMEVLTSLLKALIRYTSHDLKIQIEHLFDMSVNVIILSDKSQTIKGPIAGINNQIKLGTFLAAVSEEANLLLKDIEGAGEKRGVAIHKLEVLAEAYRSFLRKLSEEIKTADSMLMQSIGDSIANIGIMQLYASTKTDEFEDQKKLLSQVGWYIHQPGWFVHHAKSVTATTTFNELVDAPAKIGLYAIEIKNENLAKDSINAITQIALDMFEKEGGECIYGYTQPRIMEVACYIGVYALKEKMTAVVENLKRQLDKFQEKYEKETLSKFPPGEKGLGPKKNQICHDLFRMRDDLMEARHDSFSRRMMDRASDRLLERIELEDLDRFIYQFWKMWSKSSPLADEFNKDSGAQDKNLE